MSFSALQRAENSSITPVRTEPTRRFGVSVLFSEPKIPQSRVAVRPPGSRLVVSVLFSEPKIPQSLPKIADVLTRRVSVLFSEPKIPQFILYHTPRRLSSVSVLFSEPKIPQSRSATARWRSPTSFSALQRAENSSMLKRPQQA